MLGFLILIFVAVPVLELVLLIRIGNWIGVLPTILLVIATGVVGASLARSQGLAALARMQQELAQGRPPVASMIDGFLIFAAGVLLLVPGIITDVFGVAFLLPQIPAIAAGYSLGVALTWRNQARAVQAVEERDGVRYYMDRTSPFAAPRLLRTPGLRKIEPDQEAPRASIG